MRRADNLTTFMCRLSWNLGASTSWNPQGLSRPVMGLLYLLTWPLWTIFLQSWFEILPDEEELRVFVTKRYTRLRSNFWKIRLFYGGNYPGVKLCGFHPSGTVNQIFIWKWQKEFERHCCRISCCRDSEARMKLYVLGPVITGCFDVHI